MKTEVLRVVEAAYAPGSEEEWLGGIAERVLQGLGMGTGVAAYTFYLPPSPALRPVLGAYAQSGSNVLPRQVTEAIVRDEPLEHTRAAYCINGVATLSEFFAAQAHTAADVQAHLGNVASRDALGIVGVDPGGRGIVAAASLSEPTRLSPAFKRVWSRVLLHLSAGLRLRDAATVGPVPVEAVLGADGKVHDASGPARDREARSALRVAARAIDRARSSREREPEAALELWRALVDGRWSLVDQFDADGRRFLLARPNTVQAPPLRRLTPAERQVVALAALGRTNKLIAYELGVAVGTVGTLLSRAMHKLRVGSRVQLIEAWRRAQAEPGEPPA